MGRESANHSKSETLKKKSDKWFHFMYSGASLLAGRQSVYFKMVSSLRLLCSYDRTILLYFEGMTIEKNVLSQHAETIKVYDRNNKRIGEGLFKSATKSEQPGFSSSIHLQVTRKFISCKKIQLADYKTGMNLEMKTFMHRGCVFTTS